MRKLNIFITILFGMILVNHNAFSQEADALQKQIDELQNQIQDLTIKMKVANKKHFWRLCRLPKLESKRLWNSR